MLQLKWKILHVPTKTSRSLIDKYIFFKKSGFPLKKKKSIPGSGNSMYKASKQERGNHNTETLKKAKAVGAEQ